MGQCDYATSNQQPAIVHINISLLRTTAFTKLKYAGHTSDHHQPIKDIT